MIYNIQYMMVERLDIWYIIYHTWGCISYHISPISDMISAGGKVGERYMIIWYGIRWRLVEDIYGIYVVYDTMISEGWWKIVSKLPRTRSAPAHYWNTLGPTFTFQKTANLRLNLWVFSLIEFQCISEFTNFHIPSAGFMKF